MDLLRTHFKTSSKAKRWIFERGKEDERKIRRCSRGYIDGFFAKSDAAAAEKPVLQPRRF